MGHDHGHSTSADSDQRWLIFALTALSLFLVGEAIAGWVANSTALLTDAAHMLTDVTALGLAIISIRIAARPARGFYTYGFARIDALAGQANGITLLLLAAWFTVQGIRHLIHPGDPEGAVMFVVALIGVAVNILASFATARADRSRMSVRGALAHLINDLWAFAATALAGLAIAISGWDRADAVASLLIAALMVYSGVGLVRASGRVFLEAAPRDVDPAAVGQALAAVDGVAQVHDLHVWQIGPSESAVSAHVLVQPAYGCHQVGETLRQVLADDYHLSHATLQVDHLITTADGVSASHVCEDAHGPVHTASS